MSYPICGCSMTAKSNCDDCYHRSKHSEMGATWSVCTQYSDLSEATRACENSKDCKFKITHKQVREAIEKQTAKKPEVEIVSFDYGTTIEKCPCCAYVYIDKDDNYCSKCGQKLDWGE